MSLQDAMLGKTGADTQVYHEADVFMKLRVCISRRIMVQYNVCRDQQLSYTVFLVSIITTVLTL